MSIMSAVMGCIAASAQNDPNAGISLPSSISLNRTGVGIHEVFISFLAYTLVYGDAPGGGSLTYYTWNEEGKPHSDYQVRLVAVGSAPAPTTGSLNTWYNMTSAPSYHWVRNSVGTTSGNYTLEIRNVNFPSEIVATCPVGISLQRQSYGITLAGVPSSRTTSGTGNRQVQVSFQGNNSNVVVSATGASNATSNWNPNGHSRSLFQVRAVNTSGTAPSGSGTAWREANVASNWTWSRTTAGTTSGAIRLEIREKATGTILATRDFSASLTRTDTQINVTVGLQVVQDDKIIVPYWGYRSSNPSIGSVNPTTLFGANILRIETSNLSGTDQPEIELRIVLSGSRAKNFWTSLVINGVTFNSANAQFTQSFGNTEWSFHLFSENWPIKDDTPLFRGKQGTTVPVTFT